MVWALSEELLPSCCWAPCLPLAQWRLGPKAKGFGGGGSRRASKRD